MNIYGFHWGPHYTPYRFIFKLWVWHRSPFNTSLVPSAISNTMRNRCSGYWFGLAGERVVWSHSTLVCLDNGRLWRFSSRPSVASSNAYLHQLNNSNNNLHTHFLYRVQWMPYAFAYHDLIMYLILPSLQLLIF